MKPDENDECLSIIVKAVNKVITTADGAAQPMVAIDRLVDVIALVLVLYAEKGAIQDLDKITKLFGEATAAAVVDRRRRIAGVAPPSKANH
jgi:hypothetical protein